MMFLPGWAFWIIGLVVLIFVAWIWSLCRAASKDRRQREYWKQMRTDEKAWRERRERARQSVVESLEEGEDATE